MPTDNQALAKLREYTANDLSYYDAVTKLKQEGFTQESINNATYAMKKGLGEVKDDPDLAQALMAATKQMDKDHATDLKRQGHVRPVPGTNTFNWFPEYLTSWWPFVLFLVFLGFAAYILF